MAVFIAVQRPLTFFFPMGILQIEKALAPQTTSSLLGNQFSEKKSDHSGWGTWRRSLFLFVITVRYSPCDFKRYVDCSAEKRKQQHDLFKRHGESPLSALGPPGETRFFKIKVRPARHPGTGKELCRLRLGHSASLQLFSRMNRISHFSTNYNKKQTKCLIPIIPCYNFNARGIMNPLALFFRRVVKHGVLFCPAGGRFGTQKMRPEAQASGRMYLYFGVTPIQESSNQLS